ncbi:MAG: hypothetical protein IPG24_06105 [Leptospiraceae bacterium]|nr:hypothetical protein [Leptospiraceae bacterium]
MEKNLKILKNASHAKYYQAPLKYVSHGITKLVPTRPKRIPNRNPLFLPNRAIKKEAGIVRKREAIIFKETGSVDKDSLPVRLSPIKVFVEVIRRLPDCTSARERKIMIRFLYQG